MPATETAAGSGVKITAPHRPEFAEILTPQALALVAKLHRASTAGGKSCWLDVRRFSPGSTAAGCPISWKRPGASARATGRLRRFLPTCRTAGSRLPGPSIEKWSSTRSTRGENVHGGFRGCSLAHMECDHRGPDQRSRCDPGEHRLPEPRGQEIRPSRAHRHAHGPAPWLALDRAARHRGRAASLRLPLRLRASTSITTPRLCWTGVQDPTSTCPNSKTTRRRGSGMTSS